MNGKKDESPASAGAGDDIAARFEEFQSRIDFLEGEVTSFRSELDTLGQPDRLFTVPDLMLKWSLSERQVRNLMEREKIMPTYIESSVRFTRAVVETYEQEQTGFGKGKQIRRDPIFRRINPETGYSERYKPI